MGLLIPYISMCLYKARVWHIWDIVIRLCSYGGIYMCAICYIISWVHIKGGYIIRVHITEGNIWVACIQHGSYKVVAYKVVHIRQWHILYGLYKHVHMNGCTIYYVHMCILQAIATRVCIYHMYIGTYYVCVCVYCVHVLCVYSLICVCVGVCVYTCINDVICVICMYLLH